MFFLFFIIAVGKIDFYQTVLKKLIINLCLISNC